jgi:hypothetical protein
VRQHVAVMSFNQSKDKALQKLDAYFQYAKTEGRVAGFVPWRWGDRHSPQSKTGCDMEQGAGPMPPWWRSYVKSGNG